MGDGGPLSSARTANNTPTEPRGTQPQRIRGRGKIGHREAFYRQQIVALHKSVEAFRPRFGTASCELVWSTTWGVFSESFGASKDRRLRRAF